MADEEQPEETYSNIREILGSLIGATVVDITQHDWDEFEKTKKSFIQIAFNNGEYLKVYVSDDGFDLNSLAEVPDVDA